MRKRNTTFLLRSLAWIFLALVPLLVVGLYCIHNGVDPLTYAHTFDNCMDSVSMRSIIEQLIAYDGYLPLVPESMPFMVDYCTYLVCLVFFRLCYTVIIFIPQWFAVFAEKALDRARE